MCRSSLCSQGAGVKRVRSTPQWISCTGARGWYCRAASTRLAESPVRRSARRRIQPVSQRIQGRVCGVTSRSLPQAVITSGWRSQRAAR
jgi:hypothetical protein